MISFRHSILVFLLVNTCVRSENIDSKSGERDDNSGSQLSYESKIYSSHPLPQSSLALNTNGYNNPLTITRESSNSRNYGSGHQSDDHFDRKERKTLILAIPVKLSLPNSEQSDSYDSGSVAETSNSQTQTLLYGNNPYISPFSQFNSQSSSDLSEDSEPNSDKGPQLPPLSHKIYSSLESQSKGSSYSTASSLSPKVPNDQQIGLSYNSDNKYKSSEESNDQRDNPIQYLKNTNNYKDFRSNAPKGVNNKGVDSDYGSDKYKSNKSSHIVNDDSYETRIKQKERSKALYESIPETKPEYDYDISSEAIDEEEKNEDIYNSGRDYDNKNIAFVANNRKNGYKGRSLSLKPESITQFSYNNRETGHKLPAFSPEPFDGWPNYYYKSVNNWPQIQDSYEGNLMNLMNGYRNTNKESVRNSLYGQAFDVLADSQLKAASNPVPYKTLRNSKIYGAAANYQNYQPINLFAGYGRDYSLVDMNGELYPAPLVASTPPRKQHKPLKYNEFGEQGSRDSIKSPPRNPLLLRPSFMSGLRSAATKPLANYSPLASASTTHSFLSALPSLPTSFNINKSIPRQIFPLFYG